MNHGAGWIVFEEFHREGTRRLLSILPARRNQKDVISFVQQIYVDRFASIDEKLSHKKHPESSPFNVLFDAGSRTIHVGDEPVYVAIYAHKIVLRENIVKFHYRIAVNRGDPFNPVFEQRYQSITADTKLFKAIDYAVT